MVASRLDTKMASGMGNYPLPPAPMGPSHFGLAYLHGPSIWRLAPDILSTRSLNLAAIDTELVAVS